MPLPKVVKRADRTSANADATKKNAPLSRDAAQANTRDIFCKIKIVTLQQIYYTM